MATILYKNGKAEHINNPTDVPNLLKAGYTVEPEIEKEVVKPEVKKMAKKG